MKILILIVLMCLVQNSIVAQFKFEYKDSIEVYVGGNRMKMPFSGGLNYAQFSEIDFDFDGDNDLFIFDRSSDDIRLFENRLANGVRNYHFVANAERFFPQDFKYRAALLDYDGDGLNDAFTYGVGGIKVYKNIGNAQDGLVWELFKELIYSDYNGNMANLYVSSTDIPAYVDVDGDTDVDVLTFSLSGQSVEYHKNMSIEWYNTNDSLVFQLKNQCWGKFKEDPISFEVILDDITSPCVGGDIINPELPGLTDTIFSKVNTLNLIRHAGSTLLALDYDQSGVMDLILGDVSSQNLNLLLNGGLEPNSNSAMISQDNNFPSNSIPVNIPIFPAAFFLDVDFDNIKDLIASGNAKNSSQDYKGVSFYKNFGTNSQPIFVFQTNSFLQEQMLDVGRGAIPCFTDLNGDGSEDLIIGNFHRYKESLQKESVIYHYSNLGTPTSPSLTYIEDDFLSLSSQNLGLRLVPAFGDLDADNDLDVVIGLENGSLIYYENIAGPGVSPIFASPVLEFKDNLNAIIDVGADAYPQIIDLNRDNLLDLIIGNKTGEIWYYENIGTTTIPSFKLMNDTLGMVDVSQTSMDAYASPHFFRWNDTTYLLLGASDGKLRFYRGIDNHLASGDVFELVTDFFKEISVDAFSSPWINDLDHDGKLDLFVGGDLGGVYHFEHNESSSVGLKKLVKKELVVFPNPFTNELTVKGVNDFIYEFYDFMGSIVHKGKSTDGIINTEKLAKGFYYLKIIEKGVAIDTIKVTK